MKPGGTVILDESCAGLREAIGGFAPVFVFKRRNGLLATRADAAAEELQGALVANRVAAPHVLVAASFAGLTALAYAARWPANLAGLVLVDSSHPAQSAAVLAVIPDSEPCTLPVEGFRNYMLGFGPVWTESCRAVAGIASLGDVPLIVLAAGKPDLPPELSEGTRGALTQCWHDLQWRHAALSTRGQFRIVPETGHNLVAAAPEAIMDAVHEFLGHRLNL